MRMHVCIVVYTCVYGDAHSREPEGNVRFLLYHPHLPETWSLTEPRARLVGSKLQKSSCLLPTPTSHTLELKVCVLTPDILGGCWGSEFRCSCLHSKRLLPTGPCPMPLFLLCDNEQYIMEKMTGADELMDDKGSLQNYKELTCLTEFLDVHMAGHKCHEETCPVTTYQPL